MNLGIPRSGRSISGRNGQGRSQSTQHEEKPPVVDSRAGFWSLENCAVVHVDGSVTQIDQEESKKRKRK